MGDDLALILAFGFPILRITLSAIATPLSSPVRCLRIAAIAPNLDDWRVKLSQKWRARCFADTARVALTTVLIRVATLSFVEEC
jgi:hypothetical protein